MPEWTLRYIKMFIFTAGLDTMAVTMPQRHVIQSSHPERSPSLPLVPDRFQIVKACKHVLDGRGHAITY